MNMWLQRIATFLKAPIMPTHLAFDPHIIPWEYWRPSFTTAGWIVVYVLQREGEMEGMCVCVSVCVRMRVSVRMCVCERVCERDRDRDRECVKREREREGGRDDCLLQVASRWSILWKVRK